MTTPAGRALDAPASDGALWAVKDALVLTGRNLRHTTRQPELLFFSTIQPVMFLVLFLYVFGGAIANPPGLSDADFLVPGILVQTTAFASTTTGVGLADDLSKGIVDRFRALPMARSAVLTGRTFGDLVRMLGIALIIVVVGLALGLRPDGVARTVAAIALVALFGFAFSWISAWIGLSVRDVETANLAGFVWLFPLTFASSAFVPLDTLPGWLQAFATHTPVTPTVEAVRGLLNDGYPLRHDLLLSLAWIVGIIVVFSFLAVRRYRRVA